MKRGVSVLLDVAGGVKIDSTLLVPTRSKSLNYMFENLPISRGGGK